MGVSEKNPSERASEQGALTSWRALKNRQVRTGKESEKVRGTYELESADKWASQTA